MSNTPTIILYKGQSQYDVLRYFIDDLGEAFKQFGYTIEIVDLLDSNWNVKIGNLINSGSVLFALGMNAIGQELSMNDKLIYDITEIPFFSFYVDHPIHHLRRLNNKTNNLICSFIDRTHVEFVSTYLGNDCTKVFVPHGVKADENAGSTIIPIKERSIDILFPGSYTDPDEIREKWVETGPFLTKLFDDFADCMLSRQDVQHMDNIRHVLESRGLEHNPKFYNSLIPHINLIDLFVRARIRKETVEMLSDFPLHLYGNGWDKLKLGKNVQKHSPISFKEVLYKMGQSKFVLTVLPYFIDGGHERIFASMNAGAVSISNSNKFLLSEFSNGKDVVLLSKTKQEVVKQVEELLQNQDQLQLIADNGRRKVLEKHTWLHRAQQILETVFFHKAFYK